MPTKKLKQLYFLIHGLCYAEMLYGHGAESEQRLGLKAYTDREDNCAEQWRARLTHLGADEALVIIPVADPRGPAHDFNVFASETLGDRCFILECPDGSQPEFWSQGDGAFRESILHELQGAFVQQNLQCNKEEFDTDLHCLACCYLFKTLLHERGCELDPATLLTEGWGASFDGCVTKYSITMRRLLQLAQATCINYALTVPDASFLLDVPDARCIALNNDLMVWVFKKENRLLALFTRATHSLADKPTSVRLPPGLELVTVKSKQGTRLWPTPERYQVPGAPPEYWEPAQELVHLRDNRLSLPVSSGFVYRLAKAPAYIFAPPAMPEEEFSELLAQAEIVTN